MGSLIHRDDLLSLVQGREHDGDRRVDPADAGTMRATRVSHSALSALELTDSGMDSSRFSFVGSWTPADPRAVRRCLPQATLSTSFNAEAPVISLAGAGRVAERESTYRSHLCVALAVFLMHPQADDQIGAIKAWNTDKLCHYDLFIICCFLLS
jgi:hypothetical protein